MNSWTDASGRTWKLTEMSDLHLKNVIAYLEGDVEKQQDKIDRAEKRIDEDMTKLDALGIELVRRKRVTVEARGKSVGNPTDQVDYIPGWAASSWPSAPLRPLALGSMMSDYRDEYARRVQKGQAVYGGRPGGLYAASGNWIEANRQEFAERELQNNNKLNSNSTHTMLRELGLG